MGPSEEVERFCPEMETPLTVSRLATDFISSPPPTMRVVLPLEIAGHIPPWG